MESRWLCLFNGISLFVRLSFIDFCSIEFHWFLEFEKYWNSIVFFSMTCHWILFQWNSIVFRLNSIDVRSVLVCSCPRVLSSCCVFVLSRVALASFNGAHHVCCRVVVSMRAAFAFWHYLVCSCACINPYIYVYTYIYIYIHIVHYRTLQMKQRLLLICVVNLLRYACFGTYIRRYAHCFYRPTKLPPPPNKRCLCRPTDMPLPPDKHAFAARQTCLCHPTSSINQSYIINSPITPIGSGRDYSLTRLA